MIKPLHAISGGTLVANPRRKRRKAGRKYGAKKFSALSRNPRRKRRSKHAMHAKHRNPRKLSHRRRKHRNPGMDIGGINLTELGLGSVAAIAAFGVSDALAKKYMASTLASTPSAAAIAPAAVAAAAFYGHQHAKGTLKGALKYIVILGAFEAVNRVVGQQITDQVQKLLPATSGAYLSSGKYLPTGGAYLPRATSGAWLQAPTTGGAFPQGKSLFGIGA
jgi:hypothetical protein